MTRSGIESEHPDVWEAIHADEIARLERTFGMSEREARFLVRTRAPGANADADAEEYLALRDAGPTIHDFNRVRAELARKVEARVEARRQIAVEQARKEIQ